MSLFHFFTIIFFGVRQYCDIFAKLITNNKIPMKRLFFSLLTLMPITFLAQTSDYKLDSYINPDYKRKELDFTFDGAANISSDKAKFNSGYEYLNYESETQFFSGNLISRFYQVANSVKKQATRNIRLSTSGNYSNKNDIDNKDDIKYKNLGLDLSFGQYGDYFGKDKRFIEFSPNASFGYRYTLDDEYEYGSSIVEMTSKSTFINTSFQIGVGKGRIEQVGDARLAMYILSDLSKKALLIKTLSPDEVNKLAQQITSVKNKRQFDSRIRLIEEISTVDSFLIANGYVENNKGASFYTALYDNWLYAGLFERAAGSRFAVGLSPMYYWTRSKTDFELSDYYPNSNNYYSNANIGAYVSYRYEKPANLYLQHSVVASIKGNWGKYRNADDNYLSPYINGEYRLGYYPNSRTHLQGSCFFNYESIHEGDWDRYSIYSGLRENIYYYLSPQLRINVSTALTFQYYNDNNDLLDRIHRNKYPNFSFEAGLQYSFF